MTTANELNESPGTTLCKSCGLCCTGHLFIWSKLRAAELDSAQALGLHVIREPKQRGFSQPCPLWHGQCTVYSTPQYPRFCHTYKCKLLKQLLDETVSLPTALKVVQQTMGMIHEIESLLPASTNPNFRERLVAQMELDGTDPGFRSKADALVVFIKEQFGVNDFFERL